MISSVTCLALAVFFEARSESLEGQVAVINTIMNRVASESFPNTPCDVVKQGHYWAGHPVRNACHFSFWCDGKAERIDDEEAYIQALSIAVNAERLFDVTGGATYYHRDDVKPYWVNTVTPVRKIGRHIFYRSKK